MNKKIIKSVFICFVAIIILIIAENLIRSSAKVVENIKSNNEAKKEQKEYENSEKYQIDQYVKECVETVVKYIKEDNYDALYAIITPEYKNFKQFESMDALKNDVEGYLGDFDSISLLDYNEYYGRYNCKISVTKDGNMQVKKMYITKENDKAFTVIIDNLNSINEGHKKHQYSDDKIKFNIVYEVKYPDYKVYSVDVTNISGKTLEGTFADTVLLKTDNVEYEFEIDETEFITISPNATVRVNLIMKDTSSTVYAIDTYMKVIFKGKTGNVISEGFIALEEEYF